MSHFLIWKLTAQLAKQSLVERSPGMIARASSSTSSLPPGSSKIPKSPFVKIPSSYNGSQIITLEKTFFKPLLLPAASAAQHQVRKEDFRRSFDRVHKSCKPKLRLEVPPIKFAVKEYPEKYTTKPLKTMRTGGRHPDTGRVIYRRIGGGVYRDHYWIDKHRDYIPEDKVIEEKVLEIRSDPQRTGQIALVAHGDHQHWIIATEHMKVGQVLKSSRSVGRMTVRAFEGDTYAVGALPIGTVISSLEIRQGGGCVRARAAGCCAQILRKEEGSVVVQLPSKQTIKVADQCLATVGRISNPGWNKVNLLKAGTKRRMGIRPKSGLFHKKDGYCGRKVHPAKPLRSYLVPKEHKQVEYAFSPCSKSMVHS